MHLAVDLHLVALHDLLDCFAHVAQPNVDARSLWSRVGRVCWGAGRGGGGGGARGPLTWIPAFVASFTAASSGSNCGLNPTEKARRSPRCGHRTAQSTIVPGMRLIDFCERLEDMNRLLVHENGLQIGIGFPTGVSPNHIACHDTPKVEDEVEYNDVLKVDLGTRAP